VPLLRRAKKAEPPAPPAAPPGPPADSLAGDSDGQRFRTELAEGRWQEFHDFLEATRDWDARSFYVTRLAKISGRPQWLDEWQAARPASPLPLLFRGAHTTGWAWEARGAGWGDTVAEDTWPVFFSRLVEADRDLSRAAELDPEDPTPHVRSIWTAIGLQLSQDEKRRRLAEVTRRHRWNIDAHSFMIQALAAKWSGSNEAMLEFARQTSQQAPEGNNVHKIVASAHLERWLHLSREANGRERQRRYFSDAPVQQDIRQAAGRSVLGTGYTPGQYTPSARNAFAMAFYLMHDYPAQLEQMTLIGPVITPEPWQHMKGTPGEAYERCRLKALRG
jgi:hypothetical protein